MQAWSFVHVTDIHVGSPRSFRFAPAFNDNWQTARGQIVAAGPDLLLVGGDLTRDGALHRFELEAIKEDLDALPFPYHVTPGNMDTGNKHTNAGNGTARRASTSISTRRPPSSSGAGGGTTVMIPSASSGMMCRTRVSKGRSCRSRGPRLLGGTVRAGIPCPSSATIPSRGRSERPVHGR